MGMSVEVQISPSDTFTNRRTELPNQIEELAKRLHRANVFYCLEAMVQWFRVDTGRMRASFVPYLDKYQHNYMRVLKPVAGKDAKRDPNGESEGKALGFFTDQPFFTQIGSNVEYVPYVDAKTGVFDVNGVSSFRPSPYANLVSIIFKFNQFTQSNWDRFWANNDIDVLNFDQFLKRFKGMGVNGEIDLGPPEE